jgi:hypothetical protein
MLPDKGYYLMCRLLWDCAARLEDIFSLKWENIVYLDDGCATAFVTAGKTKSGDFHLVEETVKLLHVWKVAKKSGPVFT